ncbi:NAD-dependent epimerase/dehydratase family protein [Neoroseomonas alkaliterrae]|uniref:NAD-dependent epimerase/dehydratase family protein n=1 Tax=Neoroseomonas alkaliterrae TaxID=1452450 RepID=UPI0030B9C4D4
MGSHLAQALIARGDQVVVLDDLSTGRIENLAPGATLIRGDVTDAGTVRRAMEGVDGCFHLAAIASVERCRQDWMGSHAVNLGGTIRVLDAAREAAVPVVYASSAAVYGEQAALPIAEHALPRPLSSYGADKLGSELHARAGGAMHGLRSCGLRFFNVFGPRQDPGSPYSGVISIFAAAVLEGRPLTIHGDGRQTRDFIHVSDVVAALIAAAAAASTEAPVVNVCTGRPTSILDLVAEIAAIAGREARVSHGPARAGEIRHSYGDLTAMRATLGTGEPLGLREGLATVLDWIKAGRPGLSPADGA